ncbi:flagellar export chaperone FliS [Anaeromyxobacter dehalogenans]|uniref:Flagellar protein FliS like protein n=1 Tax=Anaeromyxobacter dehalogenans (strain 2CP-C) TaxID=290397 RepID=Q2IQN0_ANADE|nr:flagellar export chaperone FliS [Anaeromyxobacter dehalogenans]ABC81112.1 flagellar protein FliS like protein [Anaeromyxobacter dehalogenans 2CP-C]
MNPAARRYAQAERQTASPERLLVLLFQAALRNVRAGAAALEAGRPAEAARPLTLASDIVVELHATLDRPRAPELCDQLAAVYRFVCDRLGAAALARDARAAREAERALAPVAEAFEAVAARLAAGGR